MKRFITYLFVTLMMAAATASVAYAGLGEGLTAAKKGDFKTAFKEWKPLADQGDANAQYYLGDMYFKGYGFPRDFKLAVKWYSKAAEQDIIPAQEKLGIMYYKGQGVPQDYKLAHMWSNIAAANGSASGGKNSDFVAKKMTSKQISEAEGMVQEWLAKHQN
ncbi:MAG: tetratricopeptide repeat protein [Sneathiella sp.]